MCDSICHVILLILDGGSRKSESAQRAAAKSTVRGIASGYKNESLTFYNGAN